MQDCKEDDENDDDDNTIRYKLNPKKLIALENALKKNFAPEFLNRIDKTIVFNPLDKKVLKNIIIPMQNNRDARNIIQSQIRKNKLLKIVKF